jgi:hypothetical protein
MAALQREDQQFDPARDHVTSVADVFFVLFFFHKDRDMSTVCTVTIQVQYILCTPAVVKCMVAEPLS